MFTPIANRLISATWLGGLAVTVVALAVAHPGARSGPDTSRLSPEEAIVRALNRVTAAEDGYRLEHPTHEVRFTARGMVMTPRRGPAWSWTLTSIAAGDRALTDAMPVRPVLREVDAATGAAAETVWYARGPVVERYVPRRGSVEQQFVIPAPLGDIEADLTIVGAVESAGAFEIRGESDGWAWRGPEGEVTLGTVTVFDAEGALLPATMTATADRTEIVVDGAALHSAAYPVTVDPEVGTNDFRISDMGVDGAAAAQALQVAVAYNNPDNEYLVVWSGDDATAPLVDGEFEIFGQRLDGTTGAEVGPNDFRISDMGPDGDVSYDATEPAVAFDPISRTYLVVWTGDDNTGTLVDNEFEIFGQRLTAVGTQIGPNDFRISDMGPDGSTVYNAARPDVAILPSAFEYLVVWDGDDDTGLLVDDEFEIFGQRINAPSGAEIGVDFRISDMGPDGTMAYVGQSPAVAANPTAQEFLVVWHGTDDGGGLVMREVEIFGQRIAFGAQVGQNDFRISDMGPDGSTIYNALTPDVAYNATSNEYLVVWSGDDNNLPLVDGEFEIFTQRLNANGGEIGTNDVRISDMGPNGDPAAGAFRPAVAWDRTLNEYLVVWHGDDIVAPLLDNELEIYGQRLSSTGLEIGTNDERLSDMGTDGNASVDATLPDVAFGVGPREFLVVWSGDDDTAPLVDEEFEIYGQRYMPATTVPGPPTNLAAVVNGFDVTFTWNASVLLFPPPDRAAATSYQLEAGSATGLTDLATIPVGNVTNLQATGPAGTYFVAVRGINAAGTGPRSNEVVVVLPGGGPPPCGAPPSPPTGLSANIVGTTVTLNWSASFGCAATSYVVEAGSAAGLANLAVLDTGTTATMFVNPGTPSGAYFVRVRGRNASGDSGASNEIVVIVP